MPSELGTKIIPRVTAALSPESGFGGVQSPKTMAGPTTVMPAADSAADVLSESSVARTRMADALYERSGAVYDQELVPVAGCHVAPPSTVTSTPATTPPESVAVPETVTWVPSAMFPAVGVLMVTAGGGWALEADVATRPGCKLVGWTPMSARTLIVSC